jgi:hypothetical protein
MTIAPTAVIPLTGPLRATEDARDPKMSTGEQLRRLLDRVRWVAAGRIAGSVAFDTACAAVALGLGIAAWAAATGRGDVAARAWLASTAAVLAVRSALGARAWWRGFGRRESAAASIARSPGPLGPGPAGGDAALRHEWRGAWDLVAARGRVGSAALRSAYVDDVERRLLTRPTRAMAAIGPARLFVRVVAAAVLAAACTLGALHPDLRLGLERMLAGVDARDPPPPEPTWTALTVELIYPDHTGRAPKSIPNPSGAIRAPAGTRVRIELQPREATRDGVVVVAHDAPELAGAGGAERAPLTVDDAGALTGEFTIRASGTWRVLLGVDGDRAAPALPIELEVDRAPEIEVAPLSAGRGVSDDEVVIVRWSARDDFGVASVELAYQLADGQTRRLPVQQPAAATHTWRGTTEWDISRVPIEERTEALYWIEVVDNDPGLGLVPLPEGPGKRTRSATMQLAIEDEQGEHAQNIASLRELRDAAVDGLAARMMTGAFWADEALSKRTAEARGLLAQSEGLLTAMSATVDSLSVDALTDQRDVQTLASIHGRLLAIHRREAAAHAGLVEGVELADPAAAESTLDRIAPIASEMRTALEDEIIRLDDMVDGMLLEQLEALVARLEATQRKLVDLLEALKAGDESARAQIEQLEQRRREDLRRLAEIRAQLRSDLDEEFLNADAFAVLEQMAADEELQAMLERGEVDRALERARGELDEVSSMRDGIQQQMGDGGPASPLSEEERKRIELLRELSRLQDEEGSLRTKTTELQRHWREAVGDQAASESSAKSAAQRADALSEMLDDINDARLGREARRGLDDAKAALERLRAAAGKDAPTALELADAADAARDGIDRALGGAERGESEGKALERAKQRADALQSELDAQLPAAPEVLPPADREALEELGVRQQGLRTRASELSSGPLGDLLPQPGRQAMKRADGGMSRSGRALDRQTPKDAIGGQSLAWQGLQDAIDSLRRGSPPPPSGGSGDASTEADRDRALRDELLEAMREDAPAEFVDPVRRYYEELLR